MTFGNGVIKSLYSEAFYADCQALFKSIIVRRDADYLAICA